MEPGSQHNTSSTGQSYFITCANKVEGMVLAGSVIYMGPASTAFTSAKKISKGGSGQLCHIN